MDFKSRKFLFAEEHEEEHESPNKYASSSCFFCYGCPDDCYFLSSPPPPPPSPPQKSPISSVLIIMLAILAAAFVVLTYLTIRRYRNCRRRNSASAIEHNNNSREDFIDENHGPVVDHPIWYIRTVGLPQSAIDSIAVFKYEKGGGLIDGCDCSVCLNEFQEDESLRLLPKCSHAFHVGCIDTWLRSHMNCPVCRAPITISSLNNVNVNSVEIINSSNYDSGSVEGNDELENHRNEMEMEMDEEREIRVGVGNSSGIAIEEYKLADMVSRIEKFRVMSDLADHHRVKVDHDRELRTVRRSVSMDFSRASMMIRAKRDEGCSDSTKLGIVEKLQNSDMIDKRGFCRNSSVYRMIKSSSSCGMSSLQKGPVSMKRSFSFSGKRSLRKNNRSQESVSIPETSIQNCGR